MTENTPVEIPLFPDHAKVVDRVMMRQLADVPRERAEALVKMVLECIQEAADQDFEVANRYPAKILAVEPQRSGSGCVVVTVQERSGIADFIRTPPANTAKVLALVDKLTEAQGRELMLGIGKTSSGSRVLIEADEAPGGSR